MSHSHHDIGIKNFYILLNADKFSEAYQEISPFLSCHYTSQHAARYKDVHMAHAAYLVQSPIKVGSIGDSKEKRAHAAFQIYENLAQLFPNDYKVQRNYAYKLRYTKVPANMHKAVAILEKLLVSLTATDRPTDFTQINQIYSNIDNIYSDTREYDKALLIREKFWRAYPNELLAVHGYAIALSHHAEDYNACINLLEDFLNKTQEMRDYPPEELAKVYNTLACSCSEKGDPKKADEYLCKARACDPKNASVASMSAHAMNLSDRVAQKKNTGLAKKIRHGFNQGYELNPNSYLRRHRATLSRDSKLIIAEESTFKYEEPRAAPQTSPQVTAADWPTLQHQPANTKDSQKNHKSSP